MSWSTFSMLKAQSQIPFPIQKWPNHSEWSFNTFSRLRFAIISNFYLFFYHLFISHESLSQVLFLRLTFHIGTIVTIFFISQYLWSNKSVPRTLQVLKRQGRMGLCGVYVLTREDRLSTYTMDIPFVSIHIHMPDKWPF